MYLIAEPFWTQKFGCSEAEYEDSFWPRTGVEGSHERRFAVADGATEASFSSIWAKQLVRSYCHGEMGSEQELASALTRLATAWTRTVRRKPLPWYAEQKLESGAYAALLGLTIHDQSEDASVTTWHALASGDSCLVQVRGDTVVTTFPYTSSQEFNNRPILLSTNVAANGDALPAILTAAGSCQSGDSFYLMTDALAAWFFNQYEKGSEPWAVLRDVWHEKGADGPSQLRPFKEWVQEMRSDKSIRNDDVTLYRIEIQ